MTEDVRCGICGGPVPPHVKREHVEFTLEAMARMAPFMPREWHRRALWQPFHKSLCLEPKPVESRSDNR